MASYEQVVDEEVDEGQTVPVIYEDEDDSSEESEDLETDQDDSDEERSNEAFEGVSDIEGCNNMMSE